MDSIGRCFLTLFTREFHVREMPTTNSIPWALSFMEAFVVRQTIPLRLAPVDLNQSPAPKPFCRRPGGPLCGPPGSRGRRGSRVPVQSVEVRPNRPPPSRWFAIPTFVDSGDLKNLWFADLLAAKLATETQWVFSRLVPRSVACHRRSRSIGTPDAPDRGGPYAGRMILFLLPINIELVEKCDKITGLLPVLQTIFVLRPGFETLG